MSFHSKKLRFDLSTARDNVKNDIKGGFIRIIAASSSNATIDIAVDNGIGTNDQFSMVKRDSLTYGPGFDKLYITNTAQAGEWVEICISPSKEVFDFEVGQNFVVDSITDPVTVDTITNTVTTEELKAATLTPTLDVTFTASTQIKAANTNRRSIIVTNTSTTTSCRIGDSTVTTAKGHYLAPLASIVLDTTAAVYGVAGASVTVSVLEVID